MKIKTKTRRLIISSILTGAIMFSCAGKPPTDIGVHGERLAPCPGSPNCVSSQSEGKQHHIDPIVYNGEKTAAMEILQQVIRGMSGAHIVTDTPEYIHAEFKSRIMGFVDDVEFYFPGDSIIHVRSAARVGYSDLGVNRKRIETIRQLFAARLSEAGQP
jgi:uncharacterized protein (DUF1499 family)